MEDTGFIKFNAIKEILEEASFYGHTAKKEDGGRKITYSFLSVKWNKTIIKVSTLKLEPDNVNSIKIVINIKVNERDIEDTQALRRKLENLGKKPT